MSELYGLPSLKGSKKDTLPTPLFTVARKIRLQGTRAWIIFCVDICNLPMFWVKTCSSQSQKKSVMWGGGDFFPPSSVAQQFHAPRVHIQDLAQSIFIGCFFACKRCKKQVARRVNCDDDDITYFQQVFLSMVTVKKFGNCSLIF